MENKESVAITGASEQADALLEEHLGEFSPDVQNITRAALESAEVEGILQNEEVSEEELSEALGALQEALLEGPGLDFAERDLLRRTGAPASVPEQAAVMAKAAKVASQRAQKKAATARDEATRRKASKLERLLKAIEDFFRGLGDPPTPPKPKPQEA